MREDRVSLFIMCMFVLIALSFGYLATEKRAYTANFVRACVAAGGVVTHTPPKYNCVKEIT